MEQYEEFMNKTRSLEHGKTAQFWMLYTDLDILYLMFSRASRTNDLDLFAYCLAKLPCLFLQQVGQIIPDGWFKYHLNILNVENIHPGIRQDAGKWGLSSENDNKVFLPELLLT